MTRDDEPALRRLELVEAEVRGFRLLRPREAESLISEEEFARDEFLPYWAELWPSALALADVVAARDVDGLAVLELGCGLGLPSLVAARGGARVLATDWADDALALLRANATRNGVRLETRRFDWREQGELGTFDLVLAADVLYERRYVDVLAELLPRLGGEVLIADPGRPFLRPFLERLPGIEVAPRVYALADRT
jgi:predicted nicotinamide N-methyase